MRMRKRQKNQKARECRTAYLVYISARGDEGGHKLAAHYHLGDEGIDGLKGSMNKAKPIQTLCGVFNSLRGWLRLRTSQVPLLVR